MITRAAWRLIPVALDMASFAHPLHKLALRIDIQNLLARGDKAFEQGWPVLVPKADWRN